MTNLRALPLLLVLLLLPAPPPATAQPPSPEPGSEPGEGPVETPIEGSIPLPDVRAAEREMERAVADLREIAGPAWRRGEPPKLPRYPDLGTSQEEEAWLHRLRERPPEEWSSRDRGLLAELLAHDLPLLSAAELADDVAHPAKTVAPSLDLLDAALRFALRDRLAVLDGDEAAAATGLEERVDLAERLALQGGLFGPLISTAIHGQVLQDVRWMVERPETPEAVLERLDAMLLRWRLEVPDPGTVMALDGLEAHAQYNELARVIEPGGSGAEMAVFAAPSLRHYVTVARLCREHGCRRGIEIYRQRDVEELDPYEAISHLLMPNILNGLEKLEAFEELTALAATAVVLRLEALELGSYPPDLDRVPPPPAVDPAHLDAMVYTRPPSPGVGARLESSSDRLLEAWPEARREDKARLLTWKLPPVPERPSPGE